VFDAAWWAWAVSFSSPSVLQASWPGFLRGAGIDATDAQLPIRVRTLQVLRMLELLSATATLSPGVQHVVADRLQATLRAT